MKSKDIKLWKSASSESDRAHSEVNPDNEGLPSLTPYIIKGDTPRPAMIVCPGGDMKYRAAHEGAPIAEWLNEIGITAFILNYRLLPYPPIAAVKDAVRAVRYLRYHAQEFDIDPDRIGMIGFSGGGNFSASVGTSFDNEIIEPNSRKEQLFKTFFGEPDLSDPIEQTSAKLGAMILGYPVIFMTKERLAGELTGVPYPIPQDISVDELLEVASLQNHVSAKTPPTFLWVTATDNLNLCYDSLLFAQSLSQHNVPFEFHVFPKGGHGLGLAQDEPAVAVWPKLCEVWLRNLWSF
ncbi:MAG TPA: alpha/beta hydrolase [Bacillota bacterium]|nr:alpha/beta hydrolase [Bacillota bacterium]